MPTDEQAAAQPATGSDSGPVLLIGGTGYVGDAMRQRMREAGIPVRLLLRSSQDAARHERDGFTTAIGDVTDPDSLVRAMRGASAVVNLVAVIKERGAATFERINYQGSVNVFNAAQQAGTRRVLQMSALGAGDLPDFPYHYTKWRAENELKASGLDWTIFRPSIIFGPGDKVQFVTQLADVVRKAPIIPVVGKGDSRFQPIHLNDVSDAYIAALRDPATIGQTYELGGAEILTYEQILDECARALNKRKPKLHVPVALMLPAVALLDALPVIDPPVTREQLKMLKLDNTTERSATEALIGRAPMGLRGNIVYVRR